MYQMKNSLKSCWNQKLLWLLRNWLWKSDYKFDTGNENFSFWIFASRDNIFYSNYNQMRSGLQIHWQFRSECYSVWRSCFLDCYTCMHLCVHSFYLNLTLINLQVNFVYTKGSSSFLIIVRYFVNEKLKISINWLNIE